MESKLKEGNKRAAADKRGGGSIIGEAILLTEECL